MRLLFTEQAWLSLEEVLSFLSPLVPEAKVLQIRDRILDKTDVLLSNPFAGQIEPFWHI